jgi:Ca2+-transporting ATPase
MAVLVFGLQMVVVYVPFFQGLFGTQPLTPQQLLVSIAAGSLVFAAIEIEKWWLRNRRSN